MRVPSLTSANGQEAAGEHAAPCRALAGGSVKKPAQDPKSASEMSQAQPLDAYVCSPRVLAQSQLSYLTLVTGKAGRQAWDWDISTSANDIWEREEPCKNPEMLS